MDPGEGAAPGARVDSAIKRQTAERPVLNLLCPLFWHPGKGGLFTKGIIACIQNHYRLRSRFDRLREAGMLTQQEMANELGVTR
jgi:hypothetical protein